MNKVKEYFEQLFMMLGMQSNRIQNIDNEVQRVKKIVSKKSAKSSKKTVQKKK